ncbi:uncharacterized protein LOC142652026 isoform X2 [Rhinoderma darwinii]|uniref:uncharacterized protein LOC142652026 isoform X2 n=1 Tax=Rhinoderma darwinii TaxID=43563 RepID=UPI003F66DD0E
MRIILVLVYFTLITPGKCLTLPDFSYWTSYFQSYESPFHNLIQWTLEDFLFWMKYLPFYGSSYRTPRPWRFEGFLSDPVGDPYTPAGHKRIRERCNGNIEIGFITPRQKPTVLQTAYKWIISKFFGKNQPHVVPRKDPSECDTKLHLRLLYGAACALMISPLIVMLTVATVLAHETPRRKVSFNNIVRVRSIPPDNRGRKARCSEEHKERTFVDDKKPRRNIFKDLRSFWSCLSPERD